ncbi:MAG TPA: peptidylprolyl isomerase [Steroidobacteraceae bacterium]
MKKNSVLWLIPLLLLPLLASAAGTATLTMSDVLAASKPSDWRPLDPANTLYVDLAAGRVVIELAPQFAPKHAANIRALTREHYFDGLVINRVQDNFVVQWGDPQNSKKLQGASKTLKAEFTRPATGLSFTVLPDPDTYAPQTGWVDGFPAARESATGTAWPVHCYGVVGAGRDNDADSGGGTELYVVTGQAPRQLDRNITVVGRVMQGMELLSALPRGAAPMGMYEKPEQYVAIRQVLLAADVPVAQRMPLEVLRTDTPTFTALIESRRNRRDEWYKVPAGHIDVCNVPLPVRMPPG